MSKLTPTDLQAKDMAKNLIWEMLPEIEGWTDNQKSVVARKLAEKVCDNVISAVSDIKGMGKIHKITLWKKIKVYVQEA